MDAPHAILTIKLLCACFGVPSSLDRNLKTPLGVQSLRICAGYEDMGSAESYETLTSRSEHPQGSSTLSFAHRKYPFSRACVSTMIMIFAVGWLFRKDSAIDVFFDLLNLLSLGSEEVPSIDRSTNITYRQVSYFRGLCV